VLAVLRTPHVGRLLFTSLIGRLPMTAAGLLLILRARDLGLSYATGGAVAGAYAAGLALGTPGLARLIDRRGLTPVIIGCGIASVTCYALLATVTSDAPTAVVVALGAALGVVNPPLSASVRALWDDLLPGADARHRILSLESVFMELFFVIGPLVFVTGLATVLSVATTMAIAGAVTLGGAVLFAAQPVSRARRPQPSTSGSRFGALASAGVRAIVCVIACLGASFGAIEIACAAFAEDAGQRGATGMLLGAWGLGSVLGGLAAARAGAPADRSERLRQLLIVLALLTLVPALGVAVGLLATTTAGLIAFGVVLLGAGVAIAPTFVLLFGLMGDAAPGGAVTEAYGWLTAGITGGLAVGSALGGAAINGVDGPAGALAVAAAAALVAVGVGRLLRPLLPNAAPQPAIA
jgi:MFS family permease